MQKQAPSIGRILVAIGFALSCFGLILFLWIAFGGPIPLKPTSYEITAYFPEATQLATESDVRIGGVSVGKVKSIQLAPEDKRVNGQDTTQATIEIDPQFAPINSDARAILRQKTLLGETYVELTPGSKNGPTLPEGGTVPTAQVSQAVQLDEIFRTFNQPTRDAFRAWMQGSAAALKACSAPFRSPTARQARPAQYQVCARSRGSSTPMATSRAACSRDLARWCSPRSR